MAFLGGGGSPLTLVLALLGAGGVAGLAHSIPSIAQKTGLACKPLGLDADASQEGNLDRNEKWIRWPDGSGFSKSPKEDGLWNDYKFCYKR